MTYDEAIAFWYGRINYEVRSASPADLKLERMRAFLALLGKPQDRLRIVHVTGTKGKGSTAAMLASIFLAAGYRTGLFTSPHLIHVEERIQVDRQAISREELTALIAEIAPVVQRLEASPYQGPTFFEIGTALGFLHFLRRRVELAVVEVGLGGRFDSTNVCHPKVAVLTSVGLDHVAQLGNTLEAIAYQKAGIIKPGVPTVSGVIQPGPRAVVQQIAAELQSPLVELQRDVHAEYHWGNPSTVTVRTRRQYPPMPLGLLGEHQGVNAAIAVAVVEQLRDQGLTFTDKALAQGLAAVTWPGRIQVVEHQPACIIDCAHNVPSVEALLGTLRRAFPTVRQKRCVLAVSSDKPYPEMLAALAGYFDHFHLTRYGLNPRGVPPETLAELLPAGRAQIHPSAAEAWEAARASCTPQDLLCATGSVFLAGELLQVRAAAGL